MTDLLFVLALSLFVFAAISFLLTSFDPIYKVYAVSNEPELSDQSLPEENRDGTNLTILFTHDVHSNLMGYARAKTVMDEINKTCPEPLVVDGGDFSMGTLYQTVFQNEAAELITLGKIGYDAVAIGNHEFDYRLSGLTNMLSSAYKSGEPLPQIFLSNVDRTKSTSKSAKSFNAVMDILGQKDYKVFEKNGIKIAVFSLLGREAESYAPLNGLAFEDYLKKAKKIVASINENEAVDLILCLSHSGTNPKISKSEDHILAKNVPGIDVIISAHSHTLLREPIIINDSIIVSVGSNGKRLGKLDLKINKNQTSGSSIQEKVTLVNYNPIPLTKDIPGSKEILDFIDETQQAVQSTFLDQYEYTFEQVLANNPYRFTPFVNFAAKQQEYPLGNIVADSYIHAVKQAEGANYEKVYVALAPSGVIRASLNRGDIKVSDVFKVCSLGIGPDGKSGYPLVSAYVTGKDLRTMAEIDASITTVMPSTQLFMSGLSYSYNPNRLLLNRVVDVNLSSSPEIKEKINDKKLYRIVTDLYSTQMLSTLDKKSKGLLKIIPKDKNGKVIKDFEKYILYNEDGEVKEWLALASYLESFEKVNGISTIPEIYKTPQGREIAFEDKNIASVIKNPNKFSIAFMVAAGSLTAGIAACIAITVKKRKKRIKISVKK